MPLRRILGIGLLAACFCLWGTGAPAADRGYVVSVQFENDFFGGGTDRHFTHGTRLEVLTDPISWISDAADRLPWFRSRQLPKGSGGGIEARGSVSLGQSIYTPEKTSVRELVRDDRPYAGWLYLGIGIVANQGSNRYDKLELEVGIVGPCSQADEVQTFWHSALGLDKPRGWDNQLHTEPGLVLYYEQAHRLARKDAAADLQFDVIPHFGGALGNVFTHGAAGITLRLGVGLRDDFGPPRIRPSLPGGTYFRPWKGWTWYLFAGVEGRAVLQNIFLDGNTFRDSHSVDKEWFVADLQAGLVVQWKRFRCSYTQIIRSEEFKGQDGSNLFGSVSLSYCF